jgi:hypothetical protein
MSVLIMMSLPAAPRWRSRTGTIVPAIHSHAPAAA